MWLEARCGTNHWLFQHGRVTVDSHTSHLTACAVACATAAPFASWAVRKGHWHCPVQVVGALPMPCRGQRSLPPHLAVSP